jgi:hypothetical protein
MQMKAQAALAHARNKQSSEYPSKSSLKVKSGVVIPSVVPRFKFATGETIFTMGSCFARNIEEKLVGFRIPTLNFSVPKAEWPNRPNGILNEYNPGAMLQRVKRALAPTSDAGSDVACGTIVPEGLGFADLMLPGGSPVTYARAIERRRQIDEVYSNLSQSNVAILTLGLTECWFDTKTGLFLNRVPPLRVLKEEENRFVFRRLDVFDAFPILDSAIRLMVDAGIKVLITVSPVPLHRSFAGGDAVMSNTFSKSVLRVCAQRLYDKYTTKVDYFPSYEAIMYGGASNYEGDNVHVRDEVVGCITEIMVAHYTS